jgi:periplasmic divalent cation tolerance protein
VLLKPPPVSTTASDISIVFCTCPETVARELSTALVSSDLAACVNILPAVRSVYTWEGSVQEASEALLVIKTAAERYDALEEMILELHPYDVPEIVEIAVNRGSQAYLTWVTSAVTPSLE